MSPTGKRRSSISIPQRNRLMNNQQEISADEQRSIHINLLVPMAKAFLSVSGIFTRSQLDSREFLHEPKLRDDDCVCRGKARACFPGGQLIMRYVSMNLYDNEYAMFMHDDNECTIFMHDDNENKAIFMHDDYEGCS